MSPDPENWRHWYGSYEVSDLGRVRNSRTGNVLKDRPNPKSGHFQHNLWIDGRVRTKYLHTMVLEAFVGKRPDGAAEARHLNDQKDDNRLANLRWGTREENIRDAIDNRRLKRGEEVHGALLTESQVLEIRAAEGTQAEIASRYGVCREAVGLIRRGKNWAWLQ